jgi:hypothetical protein
MHQQMGRQHSVPGYFSGRVDLLVFNAGLMESKNEANFF